MVNETPADSNRPEDKMYAVQLKIKAGVVLKYTEVEMVQNDVDVDADNMSSINYH